MTFRGLTTDRGTEGSLQPIVEVRDALRVDPGTRELVQVSSSRPRSVTVATEQVRPPASGTVAPFRLAGDHYLVINADDYLGSARVAAAEVRLDVQVLGQAQRPPRFADLGAVGAKVSATPSKSESVRPRSIGSRDDTSSGGGGLGAGVWVAIVLVALLPATLVVLRLRRRG